MVNYRSYPDGHVEIIPDTPGVPAAAPASAAPAPVAAPSPGYQVYPDGHVEVKPGAPVAAVPAAAPVAANPCPECKGAGEIKTVERKRPLAITTRCPYCNGTGTLNDSQLKLVRDMEAALGSGK